MAQVVEHILGKDEVTGSSPVSSSKKHFFGSAFLFFRGSFFISRIKKYLFYLGNKILTFVYKYV